MAEELREQKKVIAKEEAIEDDRGLEAWSNLILGR